MKHKLFVMITATWLMACASLLSACEGIVEPADTTPPTTEPPALEDTATVSSTQTETLPTPEETQPETTLPEETAPPIPDVAASVSTDKAVYHVGEAILVTANGNDGDKVSFFPSHFTPDQKPIYEARLSGEDSISRESPIPLTDFPISYTRLPETAFYYGVLPIGRYTVAVTNPTGQTRASTEITIAYASDAITTGAELAARCLDVALNYKTLYVNGCFGAPMTASNKVRYTQNTAFNRRPDRTALINAASEDTFGFDCVCFIKGLFWGWNGDLDHVYGGAAYQANGVSDITEDSMINACSSVNTDFTAIEVGEAVWIEGHIGIYIGNGLAVECTPSWDDCVQITACNTARRGFHARTWTKHGKLPYIEYTGEYESVRDR